VAEKDAAALGASRVRRLVAAAFRRNYRRFQSLIEV
jgi:hypothetical protein